MKDVTNRIGFVHVVQSTIHMELTYITLYCSFPNWPRLCENYFALIDIGMTLNK